MRYWLSGLGGVLAVLTVLTFADAERLGGAGETLRRAMLTPSPREFACALLLFALVTSALVSQFAFAGFASTSDEIAQLWHARMLLHGRLFLPVDPNPEFFSLDTVVDRERWYSQFPIGGPALLAIGLAMRAPWLVNTLCAALAVAGLYQFTRTVFGELQGRICALLMVASPGVLLMSGTWMNHVPVLAIAMWALAALAFWERAATPRQRYAAAAAIGAGIGLIATIRPLDAVVLALVIGIFQLWTIRNSPKRVTELALQALAGAVPISILLLVNARTTGHALRFGYDVLWGDAHRPGFHVDPYGVPHTLARALEYAVTYVGQLNASVLGWPVPALLVVMLTLVSLLRATKWDALLLSLFAAQVVVYATYWYDGQFLGPRFLFTVVPVVVVFVARTPFAVAERFGAAWGRRAALATMLCIVIAWIWPGTVNAQGLLRQARSSRAALKVNIEGAIRESGIHRAVVFVREPLFARLERRLWAVGVPRGQVARLIESRDVCSLLSVLTTIESDTRRDSASAARLQSAAMFVRSSLAMESSDPRIRVSSPTSFTPECRAELRQSAIPEASFGAALVLEPIDSEGRIDGDIIYVADLGTRNEVLRKRFADRTWYRVGATRLENGELRAVVYRY